ncbi:MAG: molybdate ABC transporter substrate-binding protein [Spirochaetota bacterium]
MIRLICLLIPLFFMQISVFAAEITIGAGVGLKNVVNDISTEYIKKNPDIKINKNFVASGVLAKQLESGAKIDIVIVANREWMDYLKEKNHVNNSSITSFAYNTLVFAGKGIKRAESLNEVIKLDRIAIGSPKSVPAGEYALEAFKNSGLDKQLEKKFVLTRDVRECLLYAERGEVDGAFVYKTDALLSSAVVIWFSVPQEYYSRVVYLSALSAAGAKNKYAAEFFSYINSDEGKKFLLKYGFEIR